MGKQLGKNLPGSQQGMALITGLLFLVVLTLLGITAMDNAVMEETMVKNQRDQQVAFQAAEAAMVDGFSWLDGLNRRPRPGVEVLFGGVPMVMVNTVNTSSEADLVDPAWWTITAAALVRNYGVATNATPIAGLAVQPRHITEQFVAQVRSTRDSGNLGGGDYQAPSGKHYYSISTQASGFNAATQVVVQGIYVKRYD